MTFPSVDNLSNVRHLLSLVCELIKRENVAERLIAVPLEFRSSYHLWTHETASALQIRNF